MSILDSVKGFAGGQDSSGVMEMVGGLIQKSGGIQGLIATLEQGGLGGVMESWIGSGPNQPVSGQQLGQALQGTPADQQVDAAAQKQGTDKSSVYAQLAKILPAAIDHLTPDGKAPVGGGSGFNLGQLAGLASKLGL